MTKLKEEHGSSLKHYNTNLFALQKERRSILRTINSICIYELDKVKQSLNLMMQSLKENSSDLEEIFEDSSYLWNKKVVIFTCIHKRIQKFAKNHDRSKVLPRTKINDGNDLTI